MAEPHVDNVEVVDEKEKLEKQLKSAASWFYFIGGLSLINTVLALSGSDWGFVGGVAMTQIMDAIAREVGIVGMIISLVFDVTIAATFIVFGIFAAKRYKWAFITGMVVYALDTLLILSAQICSRCSFTSWHCIVFSKVSRLATNWHKSWPKKNLIPILSREK